MLLKCMCLSYFSQACSLLDKWDDEEEKILEYLSSSNLDFSDLISQNVNVF